MSTTPLAVPVPVVNAQGIFAPTFNQLLAYWQQVFQSIYGSDIIITPDSQDGQFIAALAQAFYDYGQMAVAVFNGYSPVFAQGAGLSAMVKINGLQRLVPTNSTAQVNVVGVANTQVFGGVAQDTNGNLWNLPAIVTIPSGGSISVTATCQALGAITAPAGTINSIFTPTKGWQSVTNPADALSGAPVETDAALRQRQAASTGLPAQSPLGAIAAAIANIAGVGRNTVYENSTGSADSNGVPGHSIAVVVEGGNSTTIAQTIEQKKSPGTGTFGSTTVLVNDPAGIPVSINFTFGTHVNIWVSVTIKMLNGYSSATDTLIENAIVNFINALTPGSSVFFNWLLSIAGLNANQTFRITAMTIGTAPSPTGTADIAIPFNEMAATALTNIVLTKT